MSISKKTITKIMYNLEISEEAYNAISETIKNDELLWPYAEEFGVDISYYEEDTLVDDLETMFGNVGEMKINHRNGDKYRVLLGKSSKGDDLKPVLIYYWADRDEDVSELDLSEATSVITLNAYSAVRLALCFVDFMEVGIDNDYDLKFYIDNNGTSHRHSDKEVILSWRKNCGYVYKNNNSMPIDESFINCFISFIKYHKSNIWVLQ